MLLGYSVIFLSLYICILTFLCSSLSFYMLTLVFFNSHFQVAISTRSSSWWIRKTLQIFELGSIYIYIFIYIQSRYPLGNVGYFNKLLIFKSLVLLVSYCNFLLLLSSYSSWSVYLYNYLSAPS